MSSMQEKQAIHSHAVAPYLDINLKIKIAYKYMKIGD